MRALVVTHDPDEGPGWLAEWLPAAGLDLDVLAPYAGDELPREVEDDVWSLTDRERRALGIKPLPSSLAEAISAMEDSELVAETLGEHVFDFFLRNKRTEWQDYRRQVTPFELNKLLPVL